MAKSERTIWKLVSIAVRAAAVLLLLLVGAGGFYYLANSRPELEVAEDAGRAPSVIVMQARPQMVARRWNGFGTAKAVDSANVPARVTATVEHIPPNILEGEAVEKGQLLVQLDDSDFVRQLEIAEQNIADLNAQLERLTTEEQSWQERVELAREAVELADADYQRISDAYEGGVAKQREVDQARQRLINAIRERVTAEEEFQKLGSRELSLNAQLLAQQSSRRLAQQNVDRAHITSPIAGVLQSVDIEVGESVAVGQQVVRVVNLDQIEVPLLLPAAARGELAVGDSVELAAANMSDQSWSGRITRIAPEDDASRRTVTVYVVLGPEALAAADAPLRPGRFVEGTVLSRTEQQRFVVPRRAMLGDHVLVVEDGVVTRQPVDVDFHIEQQFPQLGLADTQWVVLADSLPGGALVVADVGRSLRIGTVVEPVQAGSSEVVARPNGSNPTGASP